MALLNASDQFDAIAFENQLAIPETVDVAKPGVTVLEMRQSDVQLGLVDPETDNLLTTTVWGYGTGEKTGYLGPILLAEEGQETTIQWMNQLPISGYPESVPVDITLHRASPAGGGFTPTVVHLHGGETDAQFDGHPEAWYTQTKGGPGLAETGEHYAGDTYSYDNEQQAATLWYHDHALGVTRLNVYAGLAGVYKLTDSNKQALIADGILPSTEIPLVIQDKAFTSEGRLYFPGKENDVLPDGNGGSGSVGAEVGAPIFEVTSVSALPEFSGDHILANGSPWPNLNVGPGKYTFNLLNGSDSRFYVLKFVPDDSGTIDVNAVGTDGGLLNAAVDLNRKFVLAPGDRLDVVVDFSQLADGATVKLLNTGPAYEPFKGWDPVTGSLAGGVEAAGTADPVGNIMQFTVDTEIGVAPASVDRQLNAIAPLVATSERQVGVFETEDEFDRVQPLLGTADEGEFHDYGAHGTHGDVEAIRDFGPLKWGAPVTETPNVGTTENWEIFNFTADAHPMHLHGVQYQGVGRRDIRFQGDGVPEHTNGDERITYGFYDNESEIAYSGPGSADIWVGNTLRPLQPEEQGRHDTLFVAPNEMLEINAFFEKAGPYVWHCHILSHEDHEMMRPMEVLPDALLV